MKPGADIRFIDFHTHTAAGAPDTIAIMNLMAGDELPAAGRINTFYSAGIHPWQLTDAGLPQLQEELLRLADNPSVIMIGEAGFDRIRGGDDDIQYRAFLFQALLAEESRRPVLIHCVRGWEELSRARREIKPQQPWILHGFRGSSSLAATLAGEGYWFSLGVKGVKSEIVMALSHERLFLESDDSSESVAPAYTIFSGRAGYETAEAENLFRKNFTQLFQERV